MITFAEYDRILKDYEEMIKEIERKIAYRKIELRNENAEEIEVPTYSITACFAGSPVKTYNDEKLRSLEFTKGRYEAEARYIRENAEIPPQKL